MMKLASGCKTFAHHPLLKAAFRPFYLLGSLFGVYLLITSALYLSGLAVLDSDRLSFALWHGHELVFGFAGAIVLGFILTALPSWAGTEEVDGWKLLALVSLWLFGRLTFFAEQQLPLPLVAVTDSMLFILASTLVAKDLWQARNRWFMAVLLIFGGLGLGNIVFYISLFQQDQANASLAIQLALYAIIFKFVMVGGFLTVVFSNNVMAERNQPPIRFYRALETGAIVSVVALFVAHLVQASSTQLAATSLLAFAIHLIRLINMRGWTMGDQPLLLMMNIAYGWMVISFLLKAAFELNWIDTDLWLHTFTVGAMGIMMLSLMTRVALRHTGRALKVSGLRVIVFWTTMVAAAVRLAAEFFPHELLALAALLFAGAFILYLYLYGGMLYRPSLPKRRTVASNKK